MEMQQGQKLLLSLAMRQSLHVLELPIEELSQWVDEQIAENPALEYAEDESSSESTGFFEPPDLPSLSDHLTHQARLHFNTQKEIEIAQWLIGLIDQRGFIDEPLTEVEETIRRELQTFDPIGIGSTDLRDCLLIQLKNKNEPIAERIIRDHFDLLMQSHLNKIAANMNLSLPFLKTKLKVIGRLNFYPAAKFTRTPAPLISPDLILEKRGDSWTVRTADDLLPHFTLSSNPYMSSLRSRGRSILLALQRRRVTLEKIGHYLLKKQMPFFEDKERTPQPLLIKETSEELGMHFSTVARAVRDKYLFCPQGLLPFKYFFQPRTSNKLKQLLTKLIQKEEKPLTDEELMQKLQAEGVTCARRTVSKYRRLLSIPSAAVRRQIK